MSTATKSEKWVTRKIPNTVSMSPAPCRMIVVEVFKHEDGKHSVGWSDVIGFLCVVETCYSKQVSVKEYPRGGTNHAEMDELGWSSDGAPEYDVFPVVASAECGLVTVLDRGGIDHCDNRIYRCVVPCTWTPFQDRENAIRIGNEMLERGHSDMSGSALLGEEEATP